MEDQQEFVFTNWCLYKRNGATYQMDWNYMHSIFHTTKPHGYMSALNLMKNA